MNRTLEAGRVMKVPIRSDSTASLIIVIIFITEIELLSLLHTKKEFLWWNNLFSKLKFNINHDLIIFNDNRQIIRLLISKISRVETKLRHINIAQCWLRQKVEKNRLMIEYIFTVQMTANDFIKMLIFQKHRVFIQHLKLMNLKQKIMKF